MSSQLDYNERATAIIKSIPYLTLATVTPHGEPWNSPVFGVHDDDLNLYWFSDKRNQHSINVRATQQAFIVIYDSTVAEGEGEGVYIRAKVEELNNPDEISQVRKIKKGAEFIESPKEFLGDAIRRVYKAIPQKVWMNDAEVKNGTFVRDYRVELSIDKLRGLQ